jgi:NADH dehydrogenase
MTATDQTISPSPAIPPATDTRPHVLIVGAGFAGLACAQALGGHDVRVTVVDRQNYHLFVPLLYQVATAALSPADIAEPIRKILRRHTNVSVLLGEVERVDRAARTAYLRGGSSIAYDTLVVATGSVYNYFGHDQWAPLAPGVRTIANARDLRTRLLSAFEVAETLEEGPEQQALMSMVVVGGGPTGVEMAGAIAELARHALARDFRRIDPARAQVLLVEAGPRILPSFPEGLAAYARQRLEKLQVQVMTGSAVQDVRADGVLVNGRFIPARTVIWGAGIAASSAGRWLGAETDRIGRIIVNPDLSLPGDSHVYALGDTAQAAGADGKPLPGLAQVAKQQGMHLGKALARYYEQREAVPPFHFRNRGNTAIIGRNAAVFDLGRWRLKGFPAWVLWAIVHIYLLVSFEKRILVSLQWLWRYITYQRGARLITDDRPQTLQATMGGPDRGGTSEAAAEKARTSAAA